jgi:hypothetical protein
MHLFDAEARGLPSISKKVEIMQKLNSYWITTKSAKDH